MSEEAPLVVRWDTFPFDCRDVMERFRLSRFNYFHKDRESSVLMGFWEAEEGSETVGEVVGGGTADEIMVVLEGKFYVSTPGQPEQVAGPGDVVLCLRHRQTRLAAKERSRAFFLVYNMDVLEAQETFQQKDEPT